MSSHFWQYFHKNLSVCASAPRLSTCPSFPHAAKRREADDSADSVQTGALSAPPALRAHAPDLAVPNRAGGEAAAFCGAKWRARASAGVFAKWEEEAGICTLSVRRR